MKYMTNKEEERNMTEECQSVSKAKYSTEKDTVTKQVCEEVHSRVECRDMAGQECKHEPMGGGQGQHEGPHTAHPEQSRHVSAQLPEHRE